MLGLAQSDGNSEKPDFGQSLIPDTTFTGSGLNGWHTLGDAKWRAEDGDIIGNADSGSGLLVLNQSYQDVGFHSLFKCTDDCETGVLFRMEKTDNGYTGVFMSLNQNDVKPYRVKLNEQGNIISQERLEYAGGIWYRVAPTNNKGNQGYRPPEGKNSFPPRPAPKVERPFKRPDTQYRKGEWNQIESFLDVNVIRSFLNDGNEIGGRVGSASKQRSGLDGYGPIALYVGGHGQVRFSNVMWKNIAIRYTPKEKSSPHFREQEINDMYYGWAVDAADFNQDGVTDVVAGPYIYFGPDYTHRREIFPATTGSPSSEFPYNKVQHTYDFNHDGWPDILSTTFGDVTLFINPQGESRRWDSYRILPKVSQGEITALTDIDGDKIPELVYCSNGTVRYAKPNPSDPTQPWKEYIISEKGYGLAHGIGTGDINGDGRKDILDAFGWWEQPAHIEKGKLWKYHPAQLGRFGHRASHVGGASMGVYDVNGDGLNDVVTSLNAHGFGMAWFEQKRADDGSISFKEHMINDDYSAKNAGGVTFSEPHGNTFADVDGDGLMDFIVGKRYWSHLDTYHDPDPYGPPVLYWYQTVRDKDAPGGARFVPHLINNRSGAGSEIGATDLNNDGAVDIITSTDRGTFIFWNKLK